MGNPPRSSEKLQSVNDALDLLKGQTIEGMLFMVSGPGAYRLGLRTENSRLTLEISSRGVLVEGLSKLLRW